MSEFHSRPKLLEGELGVTLFHHHSRGAAPTEDGLALLERASSLVREAEQLKIDMSARQQVAPATVSVRLSPGLSVLLAGPLLEALRREQPRTRLRLVEGFSPGLQRQLLQGEIDLAVLNAPVRGAGLSIQPLLTEQMCLIGQHEPGSGSCRRRLTVRSVRAHAKSGRDCPHPASIRSSTFSRRRRSGKGIELDVHAIRSGRCPPGIAAFDNRQWIPTAWRHRFSSAPTGAIGPHMTLLSGGRRERDEPNG